MDITRTSTFSGVTRTLDLPITDTQLTDYYNGTVIQIALGDCAPWEREFFMTGVTQDEWNAEFPGDDEERDAAEDNLP